MKLLAFVLIFPIFMPLAAALDRSAFTFTRYDLELRIEPGQQRLAVRGALTLRNDSEVPQMNAVLQISSTLNWVSIRSNGKPLQLVSQIYTSDIDHTGGLSEVIVALPVAVQPKQAIELQVGYEGVVPQDTTRLKRIGVPLEKATHSDWDQISRSFTAVRGIGYVAWYPVATEAVEMAESSALASEIGRWKRREAEAVMNVNLCIVDAGKRMEGIMNDDTSEASPGVRGASEVQLAPSVCVKHRFVSLRDTVPTFAASNYTVTNKSGVKLYYLGDDQAATQNYEFALDEATDLVKKLFGERQRASAIQALDLEDAEAEPFESGNMLLVPFKAKDSVLLLSATQQLTHSLYSSAPAWVRDGLARYAQLELLAERSSPEQVNAYLQNQADELRSLEGENKKSVKQDNSLFASLDGSYIEAKAASVWWMLKDMVGANELRSALFKYRAQDDTNHSYVRKLIESDTHRDLAWFFNDWVDHDRGLPDFRIVSVYPRRLPAGGCLVTVTVQNLGGAGAEVPVILRMNPGEEKQRLVVQADSKASVRIQTATMPVEAIVNDGSVPETKMEGNSFKIQASAPLQ